MASFNGRQRQSRGTTSRPSARRRRTAASTPALHVVAPDGVRRMRRPLHLALVAAAAACCSIAVSAAAGLREAADAPSALKLGRLLSRSRFDETRQLQRERSRLEGYSIHIAAAGGSPPKLFHPEQSSSDSSDSPPVITSRIVNGARAPKRRYPWMTAVFKSEPPSPEGDDGTTGDVGANVTSPRTNTNLTTTSTSSSSSAHLEYKCGGSLVAPNVVLTAGHCAHVADAVQIGRRDMYDPHEHLSHPYETFYVKEVISHPDFANSTFAHDAALLILDGTSRAQPVVLNHQGESGLAVDEGQDMTVIGFGAVTAEGMISATLMETEVTAWSQQSCLDTYKTPRRLGDFTLCANAEDTVLDEWDEDTTDYNDACQGDSGGPLVVRRSAFPPNSAEAEVVTVEEELARNRGGGDRRLQQGMVRADDLLDVQVGIVSWGSQCGVASYPGVYARISYLYEWIEQTICDNSPDYCGKTAANVVNSENDAHEVHELDSYAPPAALTSTSTASKLPNSMADGGPLSEAPQIMEQTPACKDPESFVVFEARKNKRKTLPCSWVRENARKVCRTYQVFCPAACGSCPSYKSD